MNVRQSIRDWRAGRVSSGQLVRALRNKLLVAVGCGAGLQSAAEEFWRRSVNTYLARPEYYDRRERVLREVLGSLPMLESVADLGCGDGRFTRLLAERAGRVEAYDISPALIEQAAAGARQAGVSNVRFEVRELDEVPTAVPHDLVSCMGVTSCILDREKYLRLLERLRDLVKPGGYLLMVDSLAMGRERTAAYRSGYVARYRAVTDYIGQLSLRDFEVLRQVPIESWSGLLNQLVLAVRRPTRGAETPRADG